MPCYEINLVTVELKVKNLGLFEKALKNLDIQFQYSSDKNFLYFHRNQIRFDLKNQKVEMEYRFQDKMNQIKREYSKVVIEEVARKKRWAIKKLSNNEIQLRRG